MTSLLYIFAILVIACNANPLDRTGSATTQQASDRAGCQADVIEGKGDFKLRKKLYPVKKTGFYIESVKLLKRTSFYRCEPADVKYGVSADSYSWWVDKGCEGLFEVVECPDINRGRTSDRAATKIDISIIQTYETPAPTYDITDLEIRGIENRFLYSLPMIV